MDTFTQSYIETALWSSLTDDGQPLDDDYSDADISPDTILEMQADCLKFQQLAGDLITGKEEQAGHDFWLTRNHHGAGFWDGDWKENGDKLTELADSFKECTLYVGDDGLIYR